MTDYFSAAAGLAAGAGEASAMLSPSDPLAAPLSTLADQPSHALLGAFFEILIEHSSSGGEMHRLERALDLWTRLRELIDQLRTARAALEAGVSDPSDPDLAIAAIAAAAGARDALLPDIHDWTEQAATFLQDPNLLAYLPKSGQAADTDPKNWRWPELVVTRRTGALRRGLLKASTAPTATALALGALSGYATRLTVGSWRNAVVGGPPRNHPLRSRLVARTAGAYLRAKAPQFTPSLSSLRDHLETEFALNLPVSVATQLDKGMKAAYGPLLPAKANPDFKKAYRAMLRHLEVLDQLRFWVEAPAGQPAVPVIPPPKPPPVVVLTQAATPSAGGSGGSSGEGGLIQIQSGGGSGGGPAGTNAGAQSYTGKSGASWWKIALASLLTLLLGVVGTLLGGPLGAGVGVSLGIAFGLAIGAWKNNSADTFSQAQQALSSPDAAIVCKELFDLDMALYSAASQFLTVLKGGGLIYPETPDLATPPFKELLAVQTLEIHRAMPTADAFAAYPTSPLELDGAAYATPGWPYAPGTPATSAIQKTTSNFKHVPAITAAAVSVALWRDSFFGESILDQQNHNLEADRGFMVPCWKGQTKPQPIAITPLPYEAL